MEEIFWGEDLQYFLFNLGFFVHINYSATILLDEILELCWKLYNFTFSLYYKLIDYRKTIRNTFFWLYNTKIRFIYWNNFINLSV